MCYREDVIKHESSKAIKVSVASLNQWENEGKGCNNMTQPKLNDRWVGLELPI